MSHDDEWLTMLLRRGTALTPGDRKNRRGLEKKLKMAADQLETAHPEAAERKALF